MNQHFHSIRASIGEQISAVRLRRTKYCNHSGQRGLGTGAHIHGFGGEHELRYEAITLLRSGETYTQVGGSKLQAKPPQECLWLESYDQTRTKGMIPAATIFRNLNGSIALKTSSTTVEDALNFFVRAVDQFSFDTQVTKDIEGPIVSVGMTVTIGVIERVIAKIGINLLAYYLGRDYVADFGFRKVKDGILTGTPSVGGQIVEDVSMKAMLDAAPNNHHVIFLSKVSQSGGRAAIILVAKLYGVAHIMCFGARWPRASSAAPRVFSCRLRQSQGEAAIAD